MQSQTGGFGGGHGQISHAASSYAAVLCLALVGGEDAYKLIDREAMYVQSMHLFSFFIFYLFIYFFFFFYGWLIWIVH